MVVSPSKPYQIVYSLFQHEYLGYIFESFVVQVNKVGRLTLVHQNISAANAHEFSKELDEIDYKLIKIMDSMQQDVVMKFFTRKKMLPSEFFLKTFAEKDKKNALQFEINLYMERRRKQVLDLIKGKQLYEMNRDGEPAGKKLEIVDQPAKVIFHFHKNEDNTHYYPNIIAEGAKVPYHQNGSYIICNNPAWIVIKNKLYYFKQALDGKKLSPFLKKKFIVIPKKVEEKYYKKFIGPLIQHFKVVADGFDIIDEEIKVQPVITFSKVGSLQLMTETTKEEALDNQNEPPKILFSISFKYDKYEFRADKITNTSVLFENIEGRYVFHKIVRKKEEERNFLHYLASIGMVVRNGQALLSQSQAFKLIHRYQDDLKAAGVLLKQKEFEKEKYFLDKPKIEFAISENIDWFDIEAIIYFGQFKISFKDLRKSILNKKNEIRLPNGEIAIIPSEWFEEYSELFAFAENGEKDSYHLKKHHLSLVNDLKHGHLAKITMDKKLENLRDFETIDDHPLPKGFVGTLRPYQKAGYNWMNFLNKYNFGGCLADDMGLGKTVQTLAMLQKQKEEGNDDAASLLIMPTSLIHNWEHEAKKFAPTLKIFLYTGTQRKKSISYFSKYDLIITSYGISRLDIEILSNYYFNYIVLDESQAIKNPSSNIARAVKQLKSRRKMILTGTPLENSTMDLWSQMTFINPGLLGNKSFFRKEFQNPIEKKNDTKKTNKLNTIIKPFILRRHKSQVAKDLPEKVENIQYVEMSQQQETIYEEYKSTYRNKIIEHLHEHGMKNAKFVLLQGLTKLRQLANHPLLIDPEYNGDSGKFEDSIHMLENAIENGHKILLFSQFVKHLAIFRKYLDKKKHLYTYLDGSTKDRQKQIDDFQNKEDIRVFLISLKAGGLGLNLTKADYVFILDPWWNPAIEQQAVDRAHRIGQKNNVMTYKFISKNTVEEKILKLQKNKKTLADSLVTTEDTFVKNLSQQDIESLFD